ncbi:MAG: hypothetical protein R3C03_20765 [Pirellulaceae bacterium]
MAIRVTCPGCHARFNVSDKFAGREGPCPKCKGVIRIPSKDEEVVVHAPDEFGPKDTKGRAVLKPIARADTNLSPVQITLIVGTILMFLIGALVWRITGVGQDSATFSEIVAGVFVFLLAAPCSVVAYSFLRNQELGAFLGMELWARVGIAMLAFGITWSFMWIAKYAFNDQWTPLTLAVGASAMLLLGGAAAMVIFDFDYLTGLLHYGLYFGCCALTRWIAGCGVLPGWTELNSNPAPTETEIDPFDLSGMVSQMLQDLICCVWCGF